MRHALWTIALVTFVLSAGCLGAGDAQLAEPSADADASDASPQEAASPAAHPTTNATAAEPYDPGWPPLEDAVVRPGVRIKPGECTANFIFSSPDNRTLYLGTAAHCVRDWRVGDAVSIADGAASGTLAYSSREEPNPNDFALIAIDDQYRHLVHPAVLHYGGPTGVATDAAVGDRVLTYGNSSHRDNAQALNPRQGVVTDRESWYTEVRFLPDSILGDSGSPVIAANGRAVGVLYGGAVEAPSTDGSLPCLACNTVTNLQPALDHASETAGLDVRLATWPLLDEGPLPGAE